jgi:hypothetical protein
MNSPEPVFGEPEAPADAPIPVTDRVMLYLFFGLFILFGAIMLGDLISGLFR